MKRALRLAKNKGVAMVIPLFFSILVGVCSTLLFAVLFATVLSKVDIHANFPIFTLLCLGIGSFVLGLIHAKTHRETKVFSNMILAFVCGTIFLLLRVLCSDAPLSAMTFVKLAVVMIPIIGSALIVGNRRKSRFTH